MHPLRGAVHNGNAKYHSEVIFPTHPFTKIIVSVVVNGYLSVKNVDMTFQHNVTVVIFKPTHSLIMLI